MISHRPTFGDTTSTAKEPPFSRIRVGLVQPLDNSRVYPMERASRAGGYIGLGLAVLVLVIGAWWLS